MRAINASVARDEGPKLEAGGSVSPSLSLGVPISEVGNSEAVINCLSREVRWTASCLL